MRKKAAPIIIWSLKVAPFDLDSRQKAADSEVPAEHNFNGIIVVEINETIEINLEEQIIQLYKTLFEEKEGF